MKENKNQRGKASKANDRKEEKGKVKGVWTAQRNDGALSVRFFLLPIERRRRPSRLLFLSVLANEMYCKNIDELRQ